MPLDLLRFLKAAVLKPGQIGAIAPSSKYLAEEMLWRVREADPERVVEVGPGMGAITEHLIPRLLSPSLYMGIEANGEFLKELQSRYPGVNFVHDMVEHLDRYLAESATPGHIICSLPWSLFPASKRNQILSTLARALKTGGTLSTYAYLHGRLVPSGMAFRKELEQHFREVRHSPIVWRNLPPAVVYHCTK